MADDHADRDGDQRRNRYRGRGVLQVFKGARRQTHRAGPVARGEQIGHCLFDEAHREPPTTGAVGNRRPGRDARAHGVARRPASMISIATTSASTRMAIIPATIWSLLFTW